MTVGIVGLGLIGGSLAKAYSRAGFPVLGADIDKTAVEFAKLDGAIREELTRDTLPLCDLVLLAIEPASAAAWLAAHSENIAKSALVMDCCGTKRDICKAGQVLAAQYGYEFAGGHPMAGTHKWGYASSRADLFQGASMVVVPRVFDDMALLERIRRAVLPAGFGSVSVTTAEDHDRVIAFTSQLAHVVSNAYIKSPTAREHRGYSAGSYKDLTRVAWLNPGMWTSLFLENRDNLLREVDGLIASLSEYRAAMAAGDADTLTRLLDDGRRAKEEVDGK